jgi:hypothetical protein
MDQNFSNILDIFKRLDENSMASAEQHSTGPKFTGYWKGTDSRTPGEHMVGGMEECNEPTSLEDRLRARWEKTKQEKGLTEYGMTTGGTAGMTSGGTASTQDPQQQQQQNTADLLQTTKALQSIKSKMPGMDVKKTSTALTKADGEEPLSQIDKNAGMSLAPALADVIKNPQLAGQFKQLFDKSQQMKQIQAQKDQGQQQQPAGTP